MFLIDDAKLRHCERVNRAQGCTRMHQAKKNEKQRWWQQKSGKSHDNMRLFLFSNPQQSPAIFQGNHSRPFLVIPGQDKEHFDGQECPVIDRNLSEIFILWLFLAYSWLFPTKTNNLELRHGTACGARQQQFDDSDDVEYDALPIRFHTLSL